MACRALVLASRPGDIRRIPRSLRSLQAAGIEATPVLRPTPGLLAAQTPPDHGLLLVQAGAWLANPGPLRLPPSAAPNQPVAAIGCLRLPRETANAIRESAALWRKWFTDTGGDFTRTTLPEPPATTPTLPPWITLHLNPAAAQLLTRIDHLDFPSLLSLRSQGLRLLHYPPLDAHDDTQVRVCQIITALHRGGAERLTLDLLEILPELNVPTSLALLGVPNRSTFPTPLDTLDLGAMPGSAADRTHRLTRHTLRSGADLLHAHLLSRDQIRCLTPTHLPIVLTLHNSRPGWPPDYPTLQPGEVSLLVACSQQVETDARHLPNPPPTRTAWNGIRTDLFRPTPERILAGRRLRENWEFHPDDLVILTLANLRPQKGLQRLPAILEACRKQLLLGPHPPPRVRWVLAGEPLPSASDGADPQSRLRDTLALQEADDSVLWLGAVVDVPAVLAAADVLVCPSEFEGLSLAQIEALAMNRPVVATAVGGAPELARHHPGLHLLPPHAGPDAFAAAILAATCTTNHPHPTPAPAETGDPRLASFSTHLMAARYRWLYQRTLAAAAWNHPSAIQSSHLTARRGFWLITNHLGTGGAQSSARRLLRELHQQGVPVRAATLLEPPDLPSPGRRELLGLGIPVLALTPPHNVSTGHTIETLLDAIDADPPAAVLLWNVVPLCKLLLADALLDIPVFEVSPGEMLFDSLERYFQNPEPGLPYLTPADYGARLAGCVVKYTAEARRAADTLQTRVHVIPNGIDTREFPAAAFHSLPETTTPPILTLGTVARLHPHKRLSDLLLALRSATSRLPPWQLRIAGGPEPGFETHADELRDLARGLPVTWLGDVPDVASELARWDLALVISEPAGCPNAILEAMAVALPILATDVGGARDLIVHEESGWLVPPRDPAAFADALVRLADAPRLRRRLGGAARQRVQETFSLVRMAAAYSGLLPAAPRSVPDPPTGPVVANPEVPS